LSLAATLKVHLAYSLWIGSKAETTNESWQLDWDGRLWQRRHHDHVIRDAESLQDIYEYILNNPVRAGLVEHPDEWPWAGILDHQM
jgi:REP element-mobilizing transposase RayT